MPYTPAPWHFLYFFPDPQGQGSLRPTGAPGIGPVGIRPSEVVTVVGRGADGAEGAEGAPVNRSSVEDPRSGTGIGRGGGAGRGGSTFTWTLR
jgi:hypothetical protein